MTESITNTNEQKKEYLRGYGKHVRRIRRVESEISELRAMKMYPSAENNGMPRSSDSKDLSGYAAQLDKLESELRDERYKRIMGYKEIVSAVKVLKSENEKDVLFYRYIKELDWWEIAEKMRYAESWIYKLHGRALSHFVIPKEDSKR